MRNFFQDSPLDFRTDIGAGPYEEPIRWRPLTWNYNNKDYLNERAISTQQTGWSFVAQLRPQYPAPIGGILWFGLDDSALAVHVPMYCGIKQVPDSFAGIDLDMMSFSFDNAFWVFNMVNNLVYTRFNAMYPEVLAQIVWFESNYFTMTSTVDKVARDYYNQGKISTAIDYITNFSVTQGDNLVSDWLNYWIYLFTKYLDGNVKTRNPHSKVPDIKTPGYGNAWYKRIVDETGDRYLIPSNQDRLGSKLKNKKIFLINFLNSMPLLKRISNCFFFMFNNLSIK